jgi:hypothetical protein
MGNYQGELHLLKVFVEYDNPKEGLAEIIESLDSDYEEYADKIADNIINDPQHDGDVVNMIDALLLGQFGEVMEYCEEFKEDINALDYISTFLLQNCTYCKSYESNIEHAVKKGKAGEQLTVTYIT